MNKFVVTVVVILLALTGFILWYGGTSRSPEGMSPKMTDSAQPQAGGSMTVPPGGVTLPLPVRAPTPRINEGTVTFVIKDKAESLDMFSYILLQLKGVSVHKAGGAWVAMKSTPPLFDLLKLYRSENESAFLTELNLDVGIYDQIRLDVGSIVLVTKADGVYHEAKVPSGKIMLNANLIVEKKGLSSATIDILSEKSIHMTGSGTYIFAPVIDLETRSKVSGTQVLPSGHVTIVGGKTDTSIESGMDESGEMKKGFTFDNTTGFDVVENALRVITREEKEGKPDIKITANQAITTAIQSSYVLNVMSLKITRRATKWVWEVRGTKANGDGTTALVIIDAMTGAVIARE